MLGSTGTWAHNRKKKKITKYTRKHTIVSNSHLKQQEEQNQTHKERLQLWEQPNPQYNILSMFKEIKNKKCQCD